MEKQSAEDADKPEMERRLLKAAETAPCKAALLAAAAHAEVLRTLAIRALAVPDAAAGA